MFQCAGLLFHPAKSPSFTAGGRGLITPSPAGGEIPPFSQDYPRHSAMRGASADAVRHYSTSADPVAFKFLAAQSRTRCHRVSGVSWYPASSFIHSISRTSGEAMPKAWAMAS